MSSLPYLIRRWPLLAVGFIPAACLWVDVELPTDGPATVGDGDDGQGGSGDGDMTGDGDENVGGESPGDGDGDTNPRDGDGDMPPGDGDMGDGDMGEGGMVQMPTPSPCEPDAAMYDLSLIDDFEGGSNQPNPRLSDYFEGAWGYAWDQTATYTPNNLPLVNLELDPSDLNVMADNETEEMFRFQFGASSNWQPRAQLRLLKAGGPLETDISHHDGVLFCARGWLLNSEGARRDPELEPATLQLSLTNNSVACQSSVCALRNQQITSEWRLYKAPFALFNFNGVTESEITEALSYVQFAAPNSNDANEFHIDNIYFYTDK